jgi:hypothetical protein
MGHQSEELASRIRAFVLDFAKTLYPRAQKSEP